jgi:hypothetical protein
MIISPHAQGSVDWAIARSGIPTASEFDNLLTPEMKPRTGAMPESYLAKKVAEAWQGGPLAQLNVFDVEQGKILEDEAVPWFELEYSTPIQRIGLITTDDGRCGCSPDGLIGEDGGIEIKCPAVHTHVGYLLKGTLPKEYAAQVYGSMFVTGRKWWKFLSYRRRLPALVLTVERDEEIMETISETIEAFIDRFDSAMDRLIEINGGPPKRYTVKPAAPTYEPNENDITP